MSSNFNKMRVIFNRIKTNDGLILYNTDHQVLFHHSKLPIEGFHFKVECKSNYRVIGIPRKILNMKRHFSNLHANAGDPGKKRNKDTGEGGSPVVGTEPTEEQNPTYRGDAKRQEALLGFPK